MSIQPQALHLSSHLQQLILIELDVQFLELSLSCFEYFSSELNSSFWKDWDTCVQLKQEHT